jgi:hypothetical protein
MNRKTINKILTGKHIDFLKSIEDESIRKMVDKNSIITGGSIVSLLLNEQVKDFDYYFTDKETCKAVAEYFVNKFNTEHQDKVYKTSTNMTKPIVKEDDNGRIKIHVPSAGIASEKDTSDYGFFESLPDETSEDFVEKVIIEADETPVDPLLEEQKEKYRVVYMSSNAITLANKIQLVIRFYGPAEDIHKNYDFTHCTNYWTSKDKHLVLQPNALESILTKTLIYQGSLYPICSVIRTRKFLKQGWHINAGQLLKMCFQISKLNLEDINVLEEQLTGVDAAYFFQVIDYCKKKQEEDVEFKITAPYLCSIIDKIFG